MQSVMPLLHLTRDFTLLLAKLQKQTILPLLQFHDAYRKWIYKAYKHHLIAHSILCKNKLYKIILSNEIMLVF